MQDFLSAPRETRTPTGHTAHKALNLAEGVCALSALLCSVVFVRGAGRYGHIWHGICYRVCYHARLQACRAYASVQSELTFGGQLLPARPRIALSMRRAVEAL